MIESSAPPANLRQIIIQWEKLRFIYNGLLMWVGYATSWHLREEFGGMNHYLFWVGLYGFIANACYSLGPLLDVYLATFTGASLGRPRVLLWVFGTLVSMFLTHFLWLGGRWP